MKRYVSNERGAVMIVVLAVLLMLGLVGASMISTSTQDMAISDNFKRGSQAFYAAESGLELTRNSLWSQYVASSMVTPTKAAGDVGTYATYAAWLDALGLVDSSSLLLASNQTVAHQGRVDSVRVDRTDMPGNTALELKVRSYGSDGVRSNEMVTEVLQIGSGVFSGFDFAILAKNINCIMCHARVDNAKRFYNTDVTKQDSFDRVKVASLESMLIRTTSADSYIAGTLYTRGIVTDKSGVPITDLSPTNRGVEAWACTDGTIDEPLTPEKMTNTTGSPLPAYGNLYLNYPTNAADMTDGPLPTSFPSAIPDVNNNRIVDASEFTEIASTATGQIQGGIIYGVPAGGSYAGAALPGAGNEASVNGNYAGNLILVGTDANPIVINSKVAVDGDVIIKGKISGDGQIFAKGNVYVVGDVTYTDGSAAGNRTFGVSADGSYNALSLAAGGNIMVGDYLTPGGGNILDVNSRDAGDGTSSFSFTMSEITLFNRGEWSRTQATLPGAGGTVVANPEYDPTYIPRYYTLGAGDPVYIYNKNPISKGKNNGTYYDPATRSWKGKEHVGSYDTTMLTKINVGDPRLASAVRLNLAPNATWLTEAQLKQFSINDENARVAGTAFQFDGQLYTNNSIFSLTRSASKTAGKMQVNGSIVASDIGILVPVELRVNYDSRLRSKLQIASNEAIFLTRVSWLAQQSTDY